MVGLKYDGVVRGSTNRTSFDVRREPSSSTYESSTKMISVFAVPYPHKIIVYDSDESESLYLLLF